MKCPDCGKPTEVLDSRPARWGVRRRRRCFNDHRFTTYESTMDPQDVAELLVAARRIDMPDL